MSNQISLPFTDSIPDGAIVTYGASLWQVRFMQERPVGMSDYTPEYYCHAVPYGHNPGRVAWLRGALLADTGIRWRVPTWDEIETWSMAEHGCNTFLARLNRGIRFHCWHQPYEAEQELVTAIEAAGIEWRPFFADRMAA